MSIYVDGYYVVPKGVKVYDLSRMQPNNYSGVAWTTDSGNLRYDLEEGKKRDGTYIATRGIVIRRFDDLKTGVKRSPNGLWLSPRFHRSPYADEFIYWGNVHKYNRRCARRDEMIYVPPSI